MMMTKMKTRRGREGRLAFAYNASESYNPEKYLLLWGGLRSETAFISLFSELLRVVRKFLREFNRMDRMIRIRERGRAEARRTRRRRRNFTMNGTKGRWESREGLTRRSSAREPHGDRGGLTQKANSTAAERGRKVEG